MKKTYVQPRLQIHLLSVQSPLLDTSPNAELTRILITIGDDYKPSTDELL
ncbi:MAG: hypothetical protein IJ614_05120 [Prevotella sp.]|nr:hypothetical protein [Prevotella sp.]